MRRFAFFAFFASSLALAQPVPPSGAGCGTAAGTCRAGKFSLLAGSQLCLNRTTCTTIIKANATTLSMEFQSAVADGATAVGFSMNTSNALTTTGAKLLSLKKGGTEMFSVDKDGILRGTLTATYPTGLNLAFEANGMGFYTGSVGGGGYVFMDRNGTRWVQFGAGAVFLGTSLYPATQVIFPSTNDRATCGNRTINKTSGLNAICNGASAVTITNSIVSATSICVAHLQEVDAGCTFVNSIVPAAGSFVINVNANCTNATSTDVAWICFNQ